MAREWFDHEEFECKCGCGLNNIVDDLVYHLNMARSLAGVPFVINSGCRCSTHNEREGGSATSSHLRGLAVDIKAEDSASRYAIIHGLVSAGFNRIGVAKTFIHVDMDKSKPLDLMWLY